MQEGKQHVEIISNDFPVPPFQKAVPLTVTDALDLLLAVCAPRPLPSSKNTAPGGIVAFKLSSIKFLR